MSWVGETNPHFWPRDPPQPSGDQPGPSRPQPGRKPKTRHQPGPIHLPPPVEPIDSGPRIHPPKDHPERKSKPDHIHLPPPVEPVASDPRIHLPEDRRPWWKSKPKEQPSHTRLPPAVEPVASDPWIRPPEDRRPWWKQKSKDHARPPPTFGPVISHPQQPRPDPRAHLQPEYELTPTGHDPELLIPPTSKDHWPMHPHETSEDHWPLHPDLASQDGQVTQPHRHPKKHHHQPHVGLAPGRPPPRSQPGHWPLDPHQASQYKPPTQPHRHPKKHDHQPHVGLAPGRPPPRKQQGLPPPKQPDHAHHAQVGPIEGGRPHPRREENLIYPSPHRTNPCTWFIAVFCVILWVAIILGGILILIIYLLYRPRSPHFEISDASLNAAYLDMGYLLNADLTLLVNFTNPNRKMSVDFNFIVLKLRYENHLIANQYIEPFDAGKLEHRFARVEMVSSQIPLPVLITQQLAKQIQGNRITFELDGYFHARSRLGSIFRYSYWLYTHCTIITRGPPTGVVLFTKCITKR